MTKSLWHIAVSKKKLTLPNRRGDPKKRGNEKKKSGNARNGGLSTGGHAKNRQEVLSQKKRGKNKGEREGRGKVRKGKVKQNTFTGDGLQRKIQVDPIKKVHQGLEKKKGNG